jgi:hypothetical protein
MTELTVFLLGFTAAILAATRLLYGSWTWRGWVSLAFGLAGLALLVTSAVLA